MLPLIGNVVPMELLNEHKNGTPYFSKQDYLYAKLHLHMLFVNRLFIV